MADFRANFFFSFPYADTWIRKYYSDFVLYLCRTLFFLTLVCCVKNRLIKLFDHSCWVPGNSLSYCKDDFSLSISPISALSGDETKIHRIVFGSNDFFMFMSSLHDLKVYSKGLAFSSKKQQQRNYPGQAICWIWWGIHQLLFPLHYLPLGERSFYCSGWKWARHAFREYLNLIITIQRADSGKQTTQSFQILKHALSPTY